MQALTLGQLAAEVRLRPAVGGDLHFIQDTWLKGHALSDWGKSMSRGVYVEGQSKRMMRLLAESAVLVAATHEDENVIVGYMVARIEGERLLVHWSYVKHSWRRLGICRLMLAAMRGTSVRFVEYTHQTDKARKVAATLGASFNPYALEVAT